MSNAYAGDYKVYYWRTNPGCEVDYVLEKNGRIMEFRTQFSPYLSLVVGDGGMKAEDFLSINPVDLFK